MARLYGREWTKDELLDRAGDIDQLAGARLTRQTEGPAAGADAVELWNSSGLHLTLLPGRCLDIAHAAYKEYNLCWRGRTGDVGPAFCDPYSNEKLRAFGGGLLSTCGLTFFGQPETDPEEENRELGLHGRIGSIPASPLAISEDWEGDDYVIRVRGRMREVKMAGHCLQLDREIVFKLGEKSVAIHDRVENLSRSITAPLMILYHCNMGFPLLDAGTRLLANSRRVTLIPGGDEATFESARLVPEPEPDISSIVWLHDLEPDAGGMAEVALVNDRLGDGLGLVFRYRKDELPWFNQWGCYSKDLYVMGIEPGNASVAGRRENRAAGSLQHIEPGQTRHFNLELSILEGREEIAAFEAKLARR